MALNSAQLAGIRLWAEAYRETSAVYTFQGTTAVQQLLADYDELAAQVAALKAENARLERTGKENERLTAEVERLRPLAEVGAAVEKLSYGTSLYHSWAGPGPEEWECKFGEQVFRHGSTPTECLRSTG